MSRRGVCQYLDFSLLFKSRNPFFSRESSDHSLIARGFSHANSLSSGFSILFIAGSFLFLNHCNESDYIYEVFKSFHSNFRPHKFKVSYRNLLVVVLF